MEGKTFVIIKDDMVSEMEIEQCIVVTGKTTAIVAKKLEAAAKKVLEEINSDVDFDDELDLGQRIDELVYSDNCNFYAEGEYKVYVTDTIVVE